MAVREMQSRPIIDPLSWRYQGAVHDYRPGASGLDVAGEALPSQADQDKFWRRCQHATWYFLPWHRAYLLFFEKTVAGIVEQQGGPDDWALPYWNYGDPADPDARRLPQAFREQTMPDGSANPLFVPQRSPAANNGAFVGAPIDSSDTACLARPQFVNSMLVAQFGGGRTGFAHFGGATGFCEARPHNTMHVAVGGLGWMSDPATAALDPIFWLHHSNIDRLWELWRRNSPSHTDPSQPAWLNGLSFHFHDELGAPAAVLCEQLTDILDPFLDYDYEGLPPRAVAPPGPEAVLSAVSGEEKTPEMVGATSESVSLGSEGSGVAFEIAAPTGPAAAAGLEAVAGAAASRTEVHLVLEGVKATALPVESYEVYVNVPEGDDPGTHPELMAGVIAPFGVVGASSEESEHGGSGLSFSLDITDMVRELSDAGAWDATNLRVSFTPHRFEGDRESEAVMNPLEVGRVSLYYL